MELLEYFVYIHLLKFKNPCRRLSFQYLEHEVFSCHDTAVAKNGLYGFPCQFGMVVFFTEMAQPHVSQARCGVLHKGFSALSVAEVSTGSEDAASEIVRIRSVFEHLLVVVGLHDEIVGLVDKWLYLVGDNAHIGDYAESHALTFH